MATTHTLRERFNALFLSPTDATEFENDLLSVGRHLLPACARKVLDGETGTRAYYRFLISQVTR